MCKRHKFMATPYIYKEILHEFLPYDPIFMSQNSHDFSSYQAFKLNLNKYEFYSATSPQKSGKGFNMNFSMMTKSEV